MLKVLNFDIKGFDFNSYLRSLVLYDIILLLYKRLSNTFLAFLQSYEIIRRIVLIINHKEWKPFGIKKSMKRIIKRARIRSIWLYGITNFVFITKIIIIGPKNIIAVADTAAVSWKIKDCSYLINWRTSVASHIDKPIIEGHNEIYLLYQREILINAKCMLLSTYVFIYEHLKYCLFLLHNWGPNLFNSNLKSYAVRYYMLKKMLKWL